MIVKMYSTMIPAILAGILNMLFVRTGFCKRHSAPIDAGRSLRDGRRIFGDNKTWAGFFGMIAAGAFAQTIWGGACMLMSLDNFFYEHHANTLVFNIAAGALTGFAYVLFELPNSFIKRRLDIPCGKTDRGVKGAVFFLVDQTDSIIGVALVYAVLYPMSLWQYFLYVALGAATHIAVNLVLYKAKIRRNF